MKLNIGVALALSLLMAGCGGPYPAAETPVTASASRRSGEVLAATDYHDVLQRIYVAYFGRPADLSGLQHFAEYFRSQSLPLKVSELSAAYAADGAVRNFIDALSNSAEAIALYPGDNGAFIDAIYQNLYNRQADAAGKAFWVGALDKGIMTRANAALWIMSGAQANDVTTIDNKVTVAMAFTTALETMGLTRAYDGTTPAAVARSMLSTVGQETDAASFPVRDTIYQLANSCNFTSCSGFQFLPFAYGYWDDDIELGLVSVATGRSYASSPAQRAHMSGYLASPGFPPYSVVFWKGDRLYRQSLFSVGSAPAASIVSSLTLANACGRSVSTVDNARYLARPTSSYQFYGAKGPDNECHTADDMYHAVRTDMGSATAPLIVDKPVHAIHDAAGALTGFLVRNGLRIERVDADFADPVTMFTLAGADLQTLAHAGEQENTWIFASGGKVYAFDSIGNPGAPELILALASGETSEQAQSTDAHDTFIAIRTGTASVRVMRYNLAARSTSIAGNAGYGRMYLTPTRVLLLDPVSGAVAALPRAGGDAQEILAGTELASGGLATVVGERVWLHYRGAQKVVSVMSDGSDALRFPGAAQAGCVGDKLDACDSILIVDANHLKAYHGTTGIFQLDYGSLPAKHAGKHNMVTLTPDIVHGQGGVLTVMEQETLRQFPLSSYLFTAGQLGLIPLTVQQ